MKKKETHGLIPPTSTNPLQHVLRAHLQVMLWMADESNNITNLGWVIQDTIPGVAQGAPVPPELLDVIKCHKASSAAPRHVAATSNTLHVHLTVIALVGMTVAITLHVHLTVIALVGMTVAIRTLWDKVLKLKKQGRALMLRMKIMRRMLR